MQEDTRGPVIRQLWQSQERSRQQALMAHWNDNHFTIIFNTERCKPHWKMPTPQGKDRDKLLVAVPGIQRELAHWEQLVFSFDMDEDSQDSHEHGKGQGEISTLPTPISKPQSDTCGAEPPSSIEQALLQLLDSNSYPLIQNLLAHPSDLPNHGQAVNYFAPVYYPQPDTPISPSITYADPQLAVSKGIDSGDPVSHFLPTVASPSSSMTINTDMGEAELVALSEEKRRRNTAASARFRSKKKQRTVQLERSVSDLKGRAEELEREVTNLRRENGWLKEIVILKGSQRVAAQRQLVQRLLVQNVGIDLPSGEKDQGNGSLGTTFSSPLKETTVPEETSPDDNERGETGAGT